jgi:serine/threonine protein kinase/tetratricopeptide (TPR) repeat protein
MNRDPSRGNPDDDPTASASDTFVGADTDTAGPEAGTVPSFELVESIAMEAVAAPVIPTPARGVGVAGSEEALTSTAGCEEDAPSDSGPIASGEADPMVGRQVGPYRLTARIGGGGMGTVYRATRVEDFRQEVAVKLIKRGMDSDAIMRRFHTEIHVQAALGKHPNIAGLLDAGTTEDDRPFFVMEYVDGQQIDAYCDGRRLNVPARLSLFGQVCGAVHFAHQHAVIHRDLKPSNILVTSDGVPKLIDFGIAKLIDPDRGGDGLAGIEHLATLTRTGELVLTPEYASPEQVEGGPITTASDVYALGVLLYQLLTGRGPYRLKDRTTPEIFQAICEQVPERPSRSVVRRPVRRAGSSTRMPSGPPSEPLPSPSPAPPSAPTPEEIAEARGVPPVRLKRILTGDLDTIVLMALRKEPERRYASAEQFADDVHRYLEGLPVRAHRDSPGYRAAKFVRRHAAAVAAGIVLLLALVAGIAGTTTGLVLARRERDRAEASSRQARRAVDQFFTRVSEERLLNQPGLHPLRKTLLQDAQRFYEEFLDQRGGDPALRAELAAARARAAKITGEIGSPARAVPQFEQAVALWESLAAAQPGNSDYPQELAHTLNDLGVMLMRLEGRRDEALRIFRRAEGLLEPLVAADPRSVPRRHELSLVLQNIGQIQFEQGQPPKAIETLQKVLVIEAQLAAEDPKALAPRISMAKVHGLLGQALMLQPDGTGPALESCQKAVELREEVARERPELADQSYLLAMDLGDLNVVQQMAGKLDSALRSDRRAIEILERLDRQYPGVLNYQGGLASTYNMISDLHRRRREPAESLAFARKARAMLDRLVSEHPKDVYSRIDLAKANNNIGRVHQQSGDPVEALRSFQRAVDLYESLPELDPRNSYNLACNVALCIPLIGAKDGTPDTLDADKQSKGDRFRREKYGDRAVELLRRATRSGFLNLEVLESDTDLDAIRDRADFQDLIKEVEKKSAESPK